MNEPKEPKAMVQEYYCPFCGAEMEMIFPNTLFDSPFDTCECASCGWVMLQCSNTRSS